MTSEFIVKSIGHVLNSYDFSNSLLEQSKSISEETDEFDFSLICFVNRSPTKVEKTSMFKDLLDEGTEYSIEKEYFVGSFGGLKIRIFFFDEKEYNEKIRKDPVSYESVVLMYNSKIVFDKTGEMTKNHKLVNKIGRKQKKTDLLDMYYKASKKVELLERAYRDNDAIYFFSLCEKIKEDFTVLLFAINGKPFFSFRDLKNQVDALEIKPEDFYSNVMLATQLENTEKKILLFKRISSTFAALIGISDLKEEYVSVRKRSDDFDLRRIVEEKIKSMSLHAKPLERKEIDDFKESEKKDKKSGSDTGTEEE